MKKLFPFAVFLSVALASLVMAGFAYNAGEEAGRFKFEAAADDALARIKARIDLHLALLRATHAFVASQPAAVNRKSFAAFIAGLNIDRGYTGLRGIGFMRLATSEADVLGVQGILSKEYGLARGVWPASDRKRRLPVVFFAPIASTDGIGYDMYSDPSRRPALDAALDDGRLHSTGEVQLGQVTGGPTFPGFLVFLRLDDPAAASMAAESSSPLNGVLYAAFRANELFGAALGQTPLLPVNVEVYEGARMDSGPLLFRSQAKPRTDLGASYVVNRDLEVAGQSWTVVFRPTEAFLLPSSRVVPVALGVVGLMLAAAIALLARWQDRAYTAVETLQNATEKSLLERELMLQEMKHRIKNSIARVLAIARQTAAHSKSMDDFSQSFSARLQAMAVSQDMLTRSRWQKADLQALLRTELEQVFGKNFDVGTLSGPSVELGETTTQALGLTFHELATNALKYGDAGQGRGRLTVDWSVRKDADGAVLALTWHETSTQALSPPETTSFGTRLIDMNITRELNGTISRVYDATGLKVAIEVPVQA